MSHTHARGKPFYMLTPNSHRRRTKREIRIVAGHRLAQADTCFSSVEALHL